VKHADQQQIASHMKFKQSSATRPADDVLWPVGVQLIPETVPSGKKRKLNSQPFVLQGVIRHAISQAMDDIILKKNWPEENRRVVYGKELILKACQDEKIIHTYNIVHEVKRRIKVDPGFTKGLSDLVSSMFYVSMPFTLTIFEVVDRLVSIRGPAKTEAAKCLPSYQLGLGQSCKERVESLLQDLRFHIPGTWGGNNGNVSTRELSLPHADDLTVFC
jgi:hypothetical protein